MLRCRALSLSGSSITLLKELTLSKEAWQSKKRSRPAALPAGDHSFAAHSCSPDGQYALLDQTVTTVLYGDKVHEQSCVSWAVGAAGPAATCFLHTDGPETEDAVGEDIFTWLRGQPPRICCSSYSNFMNGDQRSLSIYDTSFRLVVSTEAGGDNQALTGHVYPSPGTYSPGPHLAAAAACWALGSLPVVVLLCRVCTGRVREALCLYLTFTCVCVADGKLLAGFAYNLCLLSAGTCAPLAHFEGVCCEHAPEEAWTYHWSPDSTQLLVVFLGEYARSVERMSLVDSKAKKLISSVDPASPIRAVLGWGLGKQGPVLLCAGEPADATDTSCPLLCMTVQGSSWSALSPVMAAAAVFAGGSGAASAALSPSGKHVAFVSPVLPGSVQFLDIAGGSVVAVWAAPAGSELGHASLEWALNGQRLLVKGATGSFLIEMDVKRGG